jgi:CBS domain-containing protein
MQWHPKRRNCHEDEIASAQQRADMHAADVGVASAPAAAAGGGAGHTGARGEPGTRGDAARGGSPVAGTTRSGNPPKERTMARTQTQNAAAPLLEELMIRDPVSVTPETTLRDVVDLLGTRHIGGMPVVANGAVVGVISVSDVLAFLASAPPGPGLRAEAMGGAEWGTAPEWMEDERAPSGYFLDFWEDAGAEVMERIREVAGPEWDLLAEHTVAEVMTPTVCSLPPDAPAVEAAEYMLRAGIHRVLVMEDGKLLGLVTTTDLLRAVAWHRS